MSTTVSYKGSTIATATNQTKTLLTQGKYLEGDISVTDVSSGASLGTKIITANGLYDASDEGYDGYSEIDVSVPNTYSASDEGKVVSSGALVAQTSDTVTANDTYDTTLINSLTVNVSGGGVTLGPMDYPVIIQNGRASGNAVCRTILYDSTVDIASGSNSMAAGSSITVNNALTDGTYIWITINNVSNITYNGQPYTNFVKANVNWKIAIPTGFDGTIPFIFTA